MFSGSLYTEDTYYYNFFFYLALSSPFPFFGIYGWITSALYMCEAVTEKETIVFASIVDFRHLQILCLAPSWECNLIFIVCKAGFSNLLDQIIENSRGYAIPLLGLGFKRTDSFSMSSRAVSDHIIEVINLGGSENVLGIPQESTPFNSTPSELALLTILTKIPTLGDPLAECSRKSSVSTTWNRKSAW